ncbi:MAG: hypothetical protein AAF962_06395 [Actinomycetota bacterium]
MTTDDNPWAKLGQPIYHLVGDSFDPPVATSTTWFALAGDPDEFRERLRASEGAENEDGPWGRAWKSTVEEPQRTRTRLVSVIDGADAPGVPATNVPDGTRGTVVIMAATAPHRNDPTAPPPPEADSPRSPESRRRRLFRR